ncbi:OTU domain-containing protein 5-B [Tetranychus urticae]|uniref:ubiquitinyl hydrolase 1 n=1 Tax=Tetranychus urticae TaxID=32264 RepID=T1JSB7_TETUR|nr:OTU domain-containing protein 5-B [Tetranychus urticae]XP_015784591.1 OTU domain-containing protein 5-B [Tetranychus urticae]
MTILSSKKERRGDCKTGNNGEPNLEKDHLPGNMGHPHIAPGLHHHASPPRWSRSNDRFPGSPGSSGSQVESGSDGTLRSTTDGGVHLSPHDAASSHTSHSSPMIGVAHSPHPAHGSKRRGRDMTRYGCGVGYSCCRNNKSVCCSSTAPLKSPKTSIKNGVKRDCSGDSSENLNGSRGNSSSSVGSSVDLSGSVVDPGPVPQSSEPIDVESDPSVQGYNSGDEYDKAANWTAEQLEEMERRFEKKMRKKGFIIKKMGEDGACLFRAVADQVYGDQDMHTAVRKLCMDYMAKNADYFSQYVTEDFKAYIQRKSLDHAHGNHVEIQALSEMYNRPIEVYHYNTTPINIFQGCHQTENEPIRLSYHQNIHYNSVVNPFKPTVGVGLGLPAYKPGIAEKNLVDKALRISEEHELEKAMLEDKLRATDWEATNEAIEEQVARESYVEWLRENEKRAMKKKSKLTATATATSNQQQISSSPSRSSPKASSSGLNNNDSRAPKDFGLVETASFVNQFTPQLFGISDWDTTEEQDIIARVLAQSQQEYLDSLKRNVNNNNNITNSSTSSTSVTASSSGTTSGPKIVANTSKNDNSSSSLDQPSSSIN